MFTPDQLLHEYEIVPNCVSYGNLHIRQEYYNNNQPAGAFSPSSAVCIFGELLNAVRGNVVSSKWYAKNAEGFAQDFMIGSSEIVIEKDGSYDISFQFQPPPNGWIPGVYRVQVYLENILEADHIFSMRQ